MYEAHHRNLQIFCDGHEFLAGIGKNHAAPQQHHGPLSGHQHVYRFLDLFGVRFEF